MVQQAVDGYVFGRSQQLNMLYRRCEGEEAAGDQADSVWCLRDKDEKEGKQDRGLMSSLF
jgi:hypothetical protein